MDRPDGSSLVTGLSLQSGTSGAIQHHVRLAVNHDIRRRTSVDSGVNSLGERINYEEASTRAMAGSHYHYDDKVAMIFKLVHVRHHQLLLPNTSAFVFPDQLFNTVS
ncbi:hypothetical protein ANCDUO_00181 [Ancylostoma duodenale]|uniref:Uncharacterized protein n=1 Tax=Ancylostoma duodenale TaxID=51022 RepID=A0A0C2E236_9BILA|nr:hypothetical protein ANCDUO_00181 [Ancylostoma duodenale]